MKVLEPWPKAAPTTKHGKPLFCLKMHINFVLHHSTSMTLEWAGPIDPAACTPAAPAPAGQVWWLEIVPLPWTP